MEKFWESMAICESDDSYWEIINTDNRLELLFFPIENPQNGKDANHHLTIKISKKQLEDLLNFAERMNKPVK